MVKNVIVATTKRLSHTANLGELNGAQLQGFAMALNGLQGVPKKGDGEAVTSEWCLVVNPVHVRSKAFPALRKLGCDVEDQEKMDGYVNFSSQWFSVTFQFNNWKKGDCVMVASAD